MARTQRATKRKSKLATSLPVRTGVTRLAGGRPSRTRSLLTASAVGVFGGVAVYRLLRGGAEE